jgi:hypothetical protein
MKYSASLSHISATIGCFVVPLAVHPLPAVTSLQLEKGGRGSSGPVRDTDYMCSVEFSSDVVPIPVNRCPYALDGSDQLRLVVRLDFLLAFDSPSIASLSP